MYNDVKPTNLSDSQRNNELDIEYPEPTAEDYKIADAMIDRYRNDD